MWRYDFYHFYSVNLSQLWLFGPVNLRVIVRIGKVVRRVVTFVIMWWTPRWNFLDYHGHWYLHLWHFSSYFHDLSKMVDSDNEGKTILDFYSVNCLVRWTVGRIGKVGKDVVKNLIIIIKLFRTWLSNPLIIRLFPHLDYHESVVLPKTRLKGLILIIKSIYQPWYVTLW